MFVGPRHRGWAKGVSVDNSALIDAVLRPRQEFYHEDLNVVSISCDVGFGKDLKIYCEEHGIKFLEFVVYFNGPRLRSEYSAAYSARHAALLEIGHEYHMVTTKNRQSNVEDIIERVKQRTPLASYCVYGEQGEVLEADGWEEETQGVEAPPIVEGITPPAHEACV